MMTEDLIIGVCVDCGGLARPRANWNAIAPAYRPTKSGYHHRCARCYVMRILDRTDGGTAIRTTRRPAHCAGCGEAIPKGSPARSFQRTRDHAHAERAFVCGACFEAWTALYTDRSASWNVTSRSP